MAVHKYILLTTLYCMVFLFVSGKAFEKNHNLSELRSPNWIFCSIDSIPRWLGDKDKRQSVLTSDTTAVKFYFIQSPCKGNQLFIQKYDIYPAKDTLIPVSSLLKEIPEMENIPQAHRRFHGDITYDFSMQNSPDTVYPGSGYKQNYVLANVYTTINDKYPVVFHFGTLQTSIPYIKNNMDISLQFDRQQYGSDMADRYRKQYQDKMRQKEKEDSNLYRTVLTEFRNSQYLQSWLVNDKQVQELMKSSLIVNSYLAGSANYRDPNVLAKVALSGMTPKDSSLVNSMKQLDSIKSTIANPSIQKGLTFDNKIGMDSTSFNEIQLKKAIKFIKTYNEKLQSLKNLKSDRDSLEKRYDSLNRWLQSRKDSLNRTLKEDVNGNFADLSDSTREQRTMNWLMGIRQLGIGRSFVNYSELSAKNISLFGFNAEYASHYYFALAAGKTDFRYQDFLTSTAVPNQYVFLGRIGLGEPEKKHLYFTFYTGSKQSSYYINNQPSTTKLTGMTLEAKIPVSKNIDITGEIANAPSYILINSSPAKLLSFNNHDNEAYSLKVSAYFPRSNTRLQAIYNRYGIYFQSFNIFNNNATSGSWQLKLAQYFFKNKLLFSASATKNDYSNPFIVNNYKSQTLVYSLQGTLRMPKWPTLTIGFLPFSQLTVLQGQITENRFYTMLGSANYGYRVKKIYMFSSIVFTQYYNSSNQPGFIYYNAKSWFFNQSVMLNHFTLGGTASLTHSPGYTVLSAGPSVQWMVFSSLSVGAGAKYNVLNDVTQNMGYNANMDCQIKRLGKISISFERGFIPGQNNQFFRNNWGKAMYSKNF